MSISGRKKTFKFLENSRRERPLLGKADLQIIIGISQREAAMNTDLVGTLAEAGSQCQA
jgi:hypothetical protein